MKDIALYLNTVEETFSDTEYSLEMFGASIHVRKDSDEEWNEDWKIALIGAQEDRASNEEGAMFAPDNVRKEFYELYPLSNFPQIVDLGNIKPGNTVGDSYFALSQVVSYLIKKDTIPFIIGGSQDITYGNYMGYRDLEQMVNLVTIDSKIDFQDKDETDDQSFLKEIMLSEPNYLFNYANIGHQSYLVPDSTVSLLQQLNFEAYRLGDIQPSIQITEPIVRNADILSIDIAAVRSSDAPGSLTGSPNGLYGENLCQIAKYSGISDKLSSIGIYGYVPSADRQFQTAKLIAQLIWCFLEGYSNRKHESPLTNKKDYVNYKVSIEDSNHDLIFLKSLKSDRWWMKVPYPPSGRFKFERHHLVPCTYSEYECATKNEIPDLWHKIYQKLNNN